MRYKSAVLDALTDERARALSSHPALRLIPRVQSQVVTVQVCLKLAFTKSDRRSQRTSDGTIVVDGNRFERPCRNAFGSSQPRNPRMGQGRGPPGVETYVFVHDPREFFGWRLVSTN